MINFKILETGGNGIFEDFVSVITCSMSHHVRKCQT